jgi:hypothetical protein
MIGQFIFHTSNRVGLKMKVILRNSLRSSSDLSESFDKEMKVSLRIFCQGNLISKMENFCTIAPGDHVEITQENCKFLADDKRDFLLVAHCKRGDGLKYFPQEHQVSYAFRGHSRETYLVYDQLPAYVEKLKTILLLAPKVWISTDFNTIISFANSNDLEVIPAKNSWVIDFLAQDGSIIRSIRRDFIQNDVYQLNVKSELLGYIKITDKLEMISVVARGESVGCVILTFIKNERTGALALEHSLSPHYYINGDFDRVRAEAFLFNRD